MFSYIFTTSMFFSITLKCVVLKNDDMKSYTLSDHNEVAETSVFPYVVAILKKLSYMSAGALLDDKWVLTTASTLLNEPSRLLRVRLGSINYKRGGVLSPVKEIEVHPLFKANMPVYDVGLIRLASSVKFSPSLYPIKMQNSVAEVDVTHFIVTAWTPLLKITPEESKPHISMDTIKHLRMLSVSHLHPSPPEWCDDQLDVLNISSTKNIMCLDTDYKADSCWRDAGAPVVLNDIVWGVISSWKPKDCSLNPSSTFVSLVGAQAIKTWIHATTSGHRWNMDAALDDGSEKEDSNEVK